MPLLNPVVGAGMGGGAGGQTTSISGGGGSHQAAAGHTGEEGMMMGMGLQIELARAQVENLKAQAIKTTAEAKKIEGVDTTKTITETESIKQGITNQQTANTLMQIQDSILRNDLWEKYESQDDRMQAFSNHAKEGIERAKQAMIQTRVDEKTADSKIKILAAQAIGELLKNELTVAQTDRARSDISVNEAEIMKIANEILLSWQHLSLEQRRTAITERIGKFNTSGSQRTYDNIIKGINTITGGLKPITLQ